MYAWGDGRDYCTLQVSQDYVHTPTLAKLLPERKAVRVACGDSFTIVVMLTKQQFSSARVRDIYEHRSALARLLQDKSPAASNEYLTKELTHLEKLETRKKRNLLPHQPLRQHSRHGARSVSPLFASALTRYASSTLPRSPSALPSQRPRGQLEPIVFDRVASEVAGGVGGFGSTPVIPQRSGGA